MELIDRIKEASGRYPSEDIPPEIDKAYEAAKNRVRSGGFQIDVDDEYINQFIRDATERAEADYNRLQEKDYDFFASEGATQSRNDIHADLAKRAKMVRLYLNTNKKQLDPQAYQNMTDWLDQYTKVQSEIVSAYRKIEKAYASPEPQEDHRTWFQAGAFEDGYQFGDVVKTALATGEDIGNNVGTAVVDATENLIDTGAHAVGTIGGFFDKDFQGNVKDFIAKDFLKKDTSGKWVNNIASIGGGGLARIGAKGLASLLSVDSEKDSLLGAKADGLVQSATHVAGSQALQRLGVPTWATMGVNAFGSELENAYQQGATWWEGTGSAAMTTAVELLTEKIFGGIKWGGKTLDDVTIKPLINKISNKAVRTLAKWGVDVAGEGLEEFLSGLGGAFAQKLTYASDKELEELFSSEEALESVIGGFILGGAGSAMNIAQTSKADAQTMKDYGSRIDALIDEALEIDPDNALATKLKKKLESGKEITGEEIRELVSANDQALRKQDQKAISDAVRQRLTELGEHDNVQAVADALAKQAAREKLTRQESDAIRVSKYGERVAYELNPENIDSGESAAAWVRNIDIEHINMKQYSPTTPIDTAPNTDYDNKNTTGGNVYGTEQSWKETHDDRTTAAGSHGFNGKAPTQAGDRSRVQSELGEDYGTLQEDSSFGRQRDGLTPQAEPFSPEDYINPEEGSALRQTQFGFKERNIECKIVSDAKWNREKPAFSRNGKVYIREGIDGDTLKTAIPHETSHIMKQSGFTPYVEFIERTPDMLNMQSDGIGALIDLIAEHKKIDIFNLSDQQLVDFYDELNATVYGMQKAGILADSAYQYGDFIPGAFTDFDGYIKELDAIHGQFTNQSALPSSSPITSVGAASSNTGYDSNTVGSAQSRFRHEQKESVIYTNTYKNATGEAVRAIGEDAAVTDPDVAKYDSISEGESLYNAVLRTRNSDEINYEYDHLLTKDGWSGEDNDTAMRVMDYLRKNNDTERLRTLRRKQREMGTQGAQLTQSFAKYTRLTTTQCTLEAMDALDALNESNVPSKFYRGKTFDVWKSEIATSIVDIANQIEAVDEGNTAGMRDIVRSLASFRRTTAWMGYSSNLTKIAETALNTVDFETARAIAHAQISQIPSDFQKRSVGEIVKTMRIHNMLSALTTVNRNLTGNVSIGVADALTDSTVGQGLDALVSLFTNKRTVGNDVIHGKTYLKASFKAAKLAALCTELDIPMESESRFTTGHTRTYSPQGGPVARFFSAYEKAMKYALEVTDKFFEGGATGAVEKSLRNLGEKANLSDEEIGAISNKSGQRRTFKDDRMATRTAKGIKKAMNEIGPDDFGAGDLSMPFAGTSTNVGHTAIDYTGGGIVSGLYEIAKLAIDVKTGKYDADGKKTIKNRKGEVKRVVTLAEAQRQAVTNAARGITGIGLVAAFTALAAKGIIGVHDDDDKDERALDQSLGLSGAQFNIDALARAVKGEDTAWRQDDWTVSIDFLEPFNAQMYVGYLLSQEESVADTVKAYPGAALQGVVRSILDMPMMQGLSDTLDMVTGIGETYEDDGWLAAANEAGGQVLGSYGSSFVPSWLRQTAQYIDPYYRDTTGDNAFQKATNQFATNIPFASRLLPKKYNGLGEEQLRYTDPVSGFFNTFVNPGDVTQINSSGIADALDQISKATGNKSIYPDYIAPSSFTTKNGTKVTISGAKMTEVYQKTYGENISRLYGELLSMDDFNTLDAAMQADILEDAKSYATDLARAAVSDYSEIPSSIAERSEGVSEAEAIINHVIKENIKGMYLAGEITAEEAAARRVKYCADSPEDAKQMVDYWTFQLNNPQYADWTQSNFNKYEDIPPETADKAITLLEDLQPEADKKTVRPIQRMETIVDSGDFSDKELEMILPLYMDGRTPERYENALEQGFSSEDFVEAYRIYLDREKGETKTRIIREMADELDVTYAVAKKLYNIYAETLPKKDD